MNEARLTVRVGVVIALHSMSRSIRWLVVAPVVLFVAATLLMSSCGGSSGCEGSFDEFGDFLAGVCPTPGPGIGFSIETIVIGNGTPIRPSPTPSPTPTGERTRRDTPTAERRIASTTKPAEVATEPPTPPPPPPSPPRRGKRTRRATPTATQTLVAQ